MSEPDEMQEGWTVPVRAPLLVAVGVLASLLVALIVAGRIYLALLASSTRPPPIAFPAPRLEIVRTIPGEPHRSIAPAPPADIRRAMAETARSGDALWGSARP